VIEQVCKDEIQPKLCMTKFERGFLFNGHKQLFMFCSLIGFTKKVKARNIKSIQNLSPFRIVEFTKSAALARV